MKKITISLLALTGISAQYPPVLLLFDYVFPLYLQRFMRKKLFFALFSCTMLAQIQAQVLLEPAFTPEGLAKIKRDTFVKSTPMATVENSQKLSEKGKTPLRDSTPIAEKMPRKLTSSERKFRNKLRCAHTKEAVGDVLKTVLEIAYLPITMLISVCNPGYQPPK
jgi:hypothetical protein